MYIAYAAYLPRRNLIIMNVLTLNVRIITAQQMVEQMVLQGIST